VFKDKSLHKWSKASSILCLFGCRENNYALIQPVFDYCDAVLGNLNKVLASKIQKLQNRDAHVIIFQGYDTRSEDLLLFKNRVQKPSEASGSSSEIFGFCIHLKNAASQAEYESCPFREWASFEAKALDKRSNKFVQHHVCHTKRLVAKRAISVRPEHRIMENHLNVKLRKAAKQ